MSIISVMTSLSVPEAPSVGGIALINPALENTVGLTGQLKNDRAQALSRLTGAEQRLGRHTPCRQYAKPWIWTDTCGGVSLESVSPVQPNVTSAVLIQNSCNQSATEWCAFPSYYVNGTSMSGGDRSENGTDLLRSAASVRNTSYVNLFCWCMSL